MPENIKQTDFNRNVIQVYTEEPNFTGYKGFDFTAIDDLEYLLRAKLIPVSSGIESILKNGSINTNQLDLNYLTDSVSVSGALISFVSGINKKLDSSFNINQLDLNYLTDSVSISGEAFAKLNNISNALNGSLVSGVNIPAGFNVYQTNLDKDLDTVTTVVSGVVSVKTEKSNTISNSTLSGSNGTVLNANPNRKELYIQNLSANALYIKYGTSASNTSFNFILSANSSIDAGDGGALNDENYNGIVSVYGTNPRYISWERS